MEYVRQEAWNEVENALDVAELLFNRQVELEMRDAPDNEQLLDREEVCIYMYMTTVQRAKVAKFI